MQRIRLCGLLLLLINAVLCEEVQFSYSKYDDYGPRRWVRLTFDDATNQCDGSAQSPIKLPKSNRCDQRSDIFFSESCSSADMTFAITNHNVQAELYDSTKCYFQHGTKAWRLISLHAHLGWEHYFSVDSILEKDYTGIRSRSEIHLVHQNTNGDIMIVAVWLEGLGSNSDHAVMEEMLTQWNNTLMSADACNAERRRRRHLDEGAVYYSDTSSSTDNNHVNPYKLIPSSSSFFSYKGSLTVPPCTEGVAWRVFETVVPISKRQFTWLTDIIIDGYIDPDTCQPGSVANSFNRTVRPVQHRNGRKIRRTCPSVDRARMFLVWGSFVVVALGMVFVSYMYRRRLCRQPKQMDDNPLVDSPPTSITVNSQHNML